MADDLVKLWLYRTMVVLGGRAGMIGSFGWEDYRVAEYLDVADCANDQGDPAMGLLTAKLDGHLAHFESYLVRKALPPALAVNIRQVGRLLRLSPTGRTLLAFVIMLVVSHAAVDG